MSPLFGINKLFAFLLVLLLFSHRTSTAQTVNSEQQKVDKLLDACKSHLFNAPDSALYYGRQLIELSERNHNVAYRGQAFRFCGIAYDIKGQYEKSLEMYSKAKSVAIALDDSVLIANTYLGEGIIYHRFNDQERALELYLDAYSVYTRQNETARLSAVLNNIGAIYNEIGLYTKALSIYRKEIKLAQQRKDSSRIALAQGNLAHSYIGLSRLDSAIVYNRKSLEISRRLNDNYSKSTSYQTAGVIYKKLYLLDSAKYYFNRAINSDGGINISTERANVFLELSEIAKLEGRNRIALSYIDSALIQFFKPQKNFEGIIRALKLKGQLLQKSGHIKEAAENFALALEYNDSLSNAEVENLLLTFELDSKAYAFEKEINQVKAQNKSLETDNQQKDKIMIGLLFGSALLIALIFALYTAWWSRNRYLRVLSDRNASLEGDLENAKRMLSVLAHDFRSPLSSVISMVETLNAESASSSLKEDFTKRVKTHIRTTLRSIDQLLYWITRDKKIVEPTRIVVKDEVEESLSIYQIEISQSNAKINLLGLDSLDIHFDPVHFDIITRNLISNALKHIPSGGEITISGEEIDGTVVLKFKDNGSGIPPTVLDHIQSQNFAALRPKNNKRGFGLGLELVFDLTQLNGAEIEITSSAEIGTEVKLIISPLG